MTTDFEEYFQISEDLISELENRLRLETETETILNAKIQSLSASIEKLQNLSRFYYLSSERQHKKSKLKITNLLIKIRKNSLKISAYENFIESQILSNHDSTSLKRHSASSSSSFHKQVK